MFVKAGDAVSDLLSAVATWVIVALYIFAVLGVSVHGINALWLAWLQRRQRTGPSPEISPSSWPRVTVQLPIYNEWHVVERLIDSVASLAYPADRLQIQVLDDSTDSTSTLIDQSVRLWRGRGIEIQTVRRPGREGFKAGALAFALPCATGELIAIFDADFLPPDDFLQRAVAHIAQPGNERVAFVQGRWEHLNRDYSILTRCQALALDGHFGVEQPARSADGLAFGFNGSAGLWRRAAIDEPAVGGWQADTLCEDLDLSYRAQLAGWKGLFLEDLAAPAEIPPQLMAFKRQQARWARGSIQTLRKLHRRIWSSDWTFGKRLAALVHLGNYLVHPLLLLLAVTLVLLTLTHTRPPAMLAALSLASLGPPILYAVSQRRLHPRHWVRNWSVIPLLSLLGIGLSIGNSVAVWQGLHSKGGEFARTPKFRVLNADDPWRSSTYRLHADWQLLAELLMGIYCTLGVWAAIRHGDPFGALFVSLFAASFLTVAVIGVWQARRLPESVGDSNGASEPASTNPANPA